MPHENTVTPTTLSWCSAAITAASFSRLARLALDSVRSVGAGATVGRDASPEPLEAAPAPSEPGALSLLLLLAPSSSILAATRVSWYRAMYTCG